MEQLLPKVLLLRVQNSIKRVVSQLYSTDQKDVVKAVLADGKTIFYDLEKKKQVTTLNVDVENWGEEDTLKLTGGKEAEVEFDKGIEKYHEMISREDLPTEKTDKPKSVQKVKKGVTKKTSSTKKTK